MNRFLLLLMAAGALARGCDCLKRTAKSAIHVKLLDSQGTEHGRSQAYLAGHRHEAHPASSLFGPRTHFELGTNIIVE